MSSRQEPMTALIEICQFTPLRGPTMQPHAALPGGRLCERHLKCMERRQETQARKDAEKRIQGIQGRVREAENRLLSLREAENRENAVLQQQEREVQRMVDLHGPQYMDVFHSMFPSAPHHAAPRPAAARPAAARPAAARSSAAGPSPSASRQPAGRPMATRSFTAASSAAQQPAAARPVPRRPQREPEPEPELEEWEQENEANEPENESYPETPFYRSYFGRRSSSPYDMDSLKSVLPHFD